MNNIISGIAVKHYEQIEKKRKEKLLQAMQAGMLANSRRIPVLPCKLYKRAWSFITLE